MSSEEGSKTSRCPSGDTSALHLRPILRRGGNFLRQLHLHEAGYSGRRPEPSGHLPSGYFILQVGWLGLASGASRVFGLAVSSVIAYRAYFSSGASRVHLYIDSTKRTKTQRDGVISWAGSIFVLSIINASLVATTMPFGHCTVLRNGTLLPPSSDAAAETSGSQRRHGSEASAMAGMRRTFSKCRRERRQPPHPQSNIMVILTTSSPSVASPLCDISIV